MPPLQKKNIKKQVEDSVSEQFGIWSPCHAVELLVGLLHGNKALYFLEWDLFESSSLPAKSKGNCKPEKIYLLLGKLKKKKKVIVHLFLEGDRL